MTMTQNIKVKDTCSKTFIWGSVAQSSESLYADKRSVASSFAGFIEDACRVQSSPQGF